MVSVESLPPRRPPHPLAVLHVRLFPKRVSSTWGTGLAVRLSWSARDGLVLAGPPQRSPGGIMRGMGGIGKAMSAGCQRIKYIRKQY